MLYRCVHSEGLLLWGRGPRSRPVCVPSGRHHRQQTTEGQPQAKLAKLFGESFGRVSVQVSTGKKKRFIKMQRLSRTHNNAWRHKAGGGRREAGRRGGRLSGRPQCCGVRIPPPVCESSARPVWPVGPRPTTLGTWPAIRSPPQGTCATIPHRHHEAGVVDGWLPPLLAAAAAATAAAAAAAAAVLPLSLRGTQFWWGVAHSLCQRAKHDGRTADTGRANSRRQGTSLREPLAMQRRQWHQQQQQHGRQHQH